MPLVATPRVLKHILYGHFKSAWYKYTTPVFPWLLSFLHLYTNIGQSQPHYEVSMITFFLWWKLYHDYLKENENFINLYQKYRIIKENM